MLAPVVATAAGAAVTSACTAVATLAAEAAPCITTPEAAPHTTAASTVAPSKIIAGRQYGCCSHPWR